MKECSQQKRHSALNNVLFSMYIADILSCIICEEQILKTLISKRDMAVHKESDNRYNFIL